MADINLAFQNKIYEKKIKCLVVACDGEFLFSAGEIFIIKKWFYVELVKVSS